MKTVSWQSVEEAVQGLKLEEKGFDLVVAIARDGLAFGELLSKKLGIPAEQLSMRFYNEEMPPKKGFAEPKLLEKPLFEAAGKKILLADKLCRTGLTMEKAVEILKQAGAKGVEPIAIAGEKDFCLFRTGECFECV